MNLVQLVDSTLLNQIPSKEERRTEKRKKSRGKLPAGLIFNLRLFSFLLSFVFFPRASHLSQPPT